MCVKQCRDENGFKCHQTSEGHLRQMRIFAENPEAVMKQVIQFACLLIRGGGGGVFNV